MPDTKHQKTSRITEAVRNAALAHGDSFTADDIRKHINPAGAQRSGKVSKSEIEQSLRLLLRKEEMVALPSHGKPGKPLVYKICELQGDPHG